MKNYLINSFAIVGAISLFIMACSADNSNTNSTSTTSAAGRYQITSGNSSGIQFYVIDTETGIVKSFSKSTITGGTVHVLNETITTQP